MQKPVFANKKAKALISCAHAADLRLCFRYIESTIFNQVLCLSARFESDLIGNPEDKVCRDAALM